MRRIDGTDFITGTRPGGGSYIHIQTDLMTDPIYRDMSFETRMIYGILLDLTYLTGERDKRRRRFLIFSSRHLCSIAQCGPQKAQRMLADLEEKNLILRQKTASGNIRLYVKKYMKETNHE